MTEKKGLLAAGFNALMRNKRYIVWIFLLNLALGMFGAVAFRQSADTILGDSLYSQKLVRGLDISVLAEMFARPEFPGGSVWGSPAIDSAVLFFLITMFVLPGVILGYASDHRVSRTEFFRTCGHNFWRFFRLFVIYLFVAGIPIGILGAIQGGLMKAADQSTNELLPFYIQMLFMVIIFLAMQYFRAWFDLAEAQVVLDDENGVRHTLKPAWRMMKGWKLAWSYVLIMLIGGLCLMLGLLAWHSIVPPASVAGAVIIAQLTLLVWLAIRYWQRAVAVRYFERLANAEPVNPLPILQTQAAPVQIAPAGTV